MNQLATIGDNRPPDMAQTAAETTAALNEWLKEHPAIQDGDKAREAKVFVDRAKLCIKDLEDERDKQVRPLNEQVKAINEHYKAPRHLLQSILEVLQFRLMDFMAKEEAKRIAAAEEARRIAEEAEDAAREAERLEQEAIDAAHVGELGVDVAAVTAEADTKFKEYQKTLRQAAIAEKETKVKIGGGFGRAIGLKKQEEISITDIHAAIDGIGPNEYVTDAILKAARAYKRLHSKYPPGISVKIERKI